MLISDKFPEGACLEYLDIFKYVHAAPHSVLNQLCNKIYQRLYLPPEVSPEYTLFDLSLARDKEIRRVVSYFREKNINKIVLKHPDAFEGNGNVFIDDAQSEEAIRQGIEKLSPMEGAAIAKNPSYLLVESQNAFSRINKKTGETKPDFAVYRIVGIADENGSLGYFILAKLISPHVDSQHNCYTLKFYSDKKTEGPSRFFSFRNRHFIKYCGPKDKYFNLGIDKTLLEKTFTSAYKLYHDLEWMTDSDLFKSHIDSLILSKKESENTDQAKKAKELSARQEEHKVDIGEPAPDVEERSRRMTL